MNKFSALGPAGPAAAIAAILDAIAARDDGTILDVLPIEVDAEADIHRQSPTSLLTHDECVADLEPDSAELSDLLRALHVLDSWHWPVGAQSSELPGGQPSETFRVLEQRLITLGAFNDALAGEPLTWHIIPARSRHRSNATTAPDLGARPLVERVAAGLRHVTAVRATVPRSALVNADERQPEWRGNNPNALHFRYRDFAASAAPLPDQLRIAIAPIPCTGCGARIDWNRDRYAIVHEYTPDAIDPLFDSAVEQQAHVLLFPEMALSPEALRQLQKRLRKQGPDKAHRILFASAGVLTPGSLLCRNEVVHLSATGEEILRQHKLTPWDITQTQAARLGHTLTANLALEQIAFGEEINLVDVPGLGRLMALICADIDDDEPKFGLLATAHVDWVHAPIMDHTVCWQAEQAHNQNLDQRWSVRNACSAASAGTRFLISNSRLLSEVSNAIRRAAGGTGPEEYVFDQIGVALLMDGSSGRIQHFHGFSSDRSEPGIICFNWPTQLTPWPPS